jgi:outer membrane receptor protein involved in Fe transport
MFGRFSAVLLSTTFMTAAAYGQTPPAAPAKGLEEIVVTATKRSESLQSVPLSIQALSTQKLDQLNVSTFNDFATLFPSVSFQNFTPGSTNVYIRGVASGGDGNHSGPLPSVGVYLDEQPVTTIGGAVDINIYDIERIESLAGPQGTLYGASSQAGTIRIITNKPDHKGFYGRWDVEANKILDGETGGKLQGMVNVPLTDKAALRVVGWYKKTGGYIDNVRGTRAFLPQPGGITVNNAAFVKDDFNDVEVYGGRAALKIDLDDNWTVTASAQGQAQRANGVFGFDSSVGDLKVQHFAPDHSADEFYQAALTIQGKIANFDVTYAGAYLGRNVATTSDYTDYAESYDAAYASYGGVAGYFYFQDSLGRTIDPRQITLGGSDFTKESHEFRIASPADKRLRLIAGAYYQKQTHEITQDYRVAGLAPALSVNGLPGTLWLTKQDREDKDTALFGEATLDVTEKLSLTAGVRLFEYDNSLIGFFGFGRNPAGAPFNPASSSATGVGGCYTTTGAILNVNRGGTLLPAAVAGGPCTDLAVFSNGGLSPKRAQGDGTTYKFNATYKFTPDVMVYTTASSGFRPGGINRRATLPPYEDDKLKNVEIGWKTTLFDRALRWNGAIYQQKWEKFQFAFLGLNSFTQIQNGPDAKINGVETDMTWVPASGFTLNASAAYTDAKTESDIVVPKGTRLPITPKLKLAATGRYEFTLGNIPQFTQLVVKYHDSARSDLRIPDSIRIGDLPSATTLNWSYGLTYKTIDAELFVDNVTDERDQLTRFTQCSICTRAYAVVETPRTIGIKIGSKF